MESGLPSKTEDRQGELAGAFLAQKGWRLLGAPRTASDGHAVLVAFKDGTLAAFDVCPEPGGLPSYDGPCVRERVAMAAEAAEGLEPGSALACELAIVREVRIPPDRILLSLRSAAVVPIS